MKGFLLFCSDLHFLRVGNISTIKQMSAKSLEWSDINTEDSYTKPNIIAIERLGAKIFVLCCIKIPPMVIYK